MQKNQSEALKMDIKKTKAFTFSCTAMCTRSSCVRKTVSRSLNPSLMKKNVLVEVCEMGNYCL